jgi:hypothetical protein
MKNWRWEEFDYGGRVQLPVKAFSLAIDLYDAAGRQYTQNWTCGDVSKFRPSEDGKSVQFVGSADSLPANSNAYELLVSLVNNGYPVTKLQASGMECNLAKADLEDIEVELVAKVMDRQGLAPRVDANGAAARPATTLVARQLVHLPWDTTTQSVISAAVIQNTIAVGAPSAVGNGLTPPPPPVMGAAAPPPIMASAPVADADQNQIEQWAAEVVGATMEGLAAGTHVKRVAFTTALFKRSDIPGPQRMRVSQLLSGNWPAEAGLVRFEGAEAVAG